MQYTITINQKAVIELGLNLDVLDMAIFDFIVHFAHWDKCQRLQTNSGVYFALQHKTIISQMPILGINTAAGILRRINKLIEAELLERHPDCEMMKMTFYKFGRNYDKVFFATPNENLQPPMKISVTPNESLGITPNENLGYNHNNKGHNNSNHNKTAESVLFPDEPVEKKPKGTSEGKFILFENSRYADIEIFCQEFNKPEYAGIDIIYYYHAVADWSASNGAKKKDWISTARNFMRTDEAAGKLHKLPGTELSASAVKYLEAMAE